MNHLDDYLDGSLSPQIVEEFDRHLTCCPSCVAYLNTYRRTRELLGRMGTAEMPGSLKFHLREYLLAHL